MHEVLELVDRAASSPSTVLLTGETGTGKEVIARELHARSGRSEEPFVAINCAAFPETLLESELFGHVKGAFTGADRAKSGLFEAALDGTLFLDEIAEMGLPLQAKLLRVLQEREVRPVGGTRIVRVECRIVAATNRVLAEEVAAGHFREDLFYRLNVFPIRIPPLRERKHDILPLARHFVSLHGPREGKLGCHLSLAASQLLQSYRWPGNVRELENEMLRALMMTASGELITPKALSARLVEILEPVAEGARPDETLREALERVETWMIRRALANNGGRKARTARKLGLTREGLYKKLKRLGIE
jgi:Nif-specific regulatory protein